MAPKRKKKLAANPARGFATSSLPSKNVEVAEPINHENETKPSSVPDGTEDQLNDNVDLNREDSGFTATIAQKELQHVSPEELERQLEHDELQLFVENNSPKVIKDSQRQSKNLAIDLRTLRAQSQPLDLNHWLPQDVVDDLLKISQASRSQVDASVPMSKTPVDEWVLRFWSLYKVLREMGISHDRIFQLLKTIPLRESDSRNAFIVWGVEEALDILTLDIEPELPPYEIPKHGTNNASSNGRPVSKPSSKAATPGPSGTTTPQILDVEDDIEVSDWDSDAEPDQLVETYLSAKSRLLTIDPALVSDDTAKQSKKKPGATTLPITSPGIRKLQDKIRRIESDPLLDLYPAKVRWAKEKVLLLQERPRQPRKPKPIRNKAQAAVTSSPKQSVDIPTPPEDDSLVGDMFVAPDDVIEHHSDPAGSVSLRDFGKVTGYPPRRLLEDYCRSRYVTWLSQLCIC